MSRSYRRFTKRDFERVERFLREKKSWRDIGRAMKRAHGNVFRAYQRWKGGK